MIDVDDALSQLDRLNLRSGRVAESAGGSPDDC